LLLSLHFVILSEFCLRAARIAGDVGASVLGRALRLPFPSVILSEVGLRCAQANKSKDPASREIATGVARNSSGASQKRLRSAKPLIRPE